MNKIIIDREQLEALMRLLVDDGHMTPVATMQINKVLDEAARLPLTDDEMDELRRI